MTDTTTATALRMERTFDASRDAVFDAWTNPEVLRRWWAVGPDWETPLAVVDLREGGAYRLTMRDPGSGMEHTVGGTFREVRRPERLVYTCKALAALLAGAAGGGPVVFWNSNNGRDYPPAEPPRSP